MKHIQHVPCPILDLLTNEEIHRALLRTALARQDISDPDYFMENHNLESQVVYRDVHVADGATMMMASVAITKITPKGTTDTQVKSE